MVDRAWALARARALWQKVLEAQSHYKGLPCDDTNSDVAFDMIGRAQSLDRAREDFKRFTDSLLRIGALSLSDVIKTKRGDE